MGPSRPTCQGRQGHWNLHCFQLATCDFPLVIHSNHGPISYRFRDKWQFWLKIANFSHPMYLAPLLRGFLEICNVTGAQKI